MNTPTKNTHRAPALWRAIRVPALALLLVMIAAWILYLEKGSSIPSLPSILAETKALQSSLQSIYNVDELSRVHSYLRAQQAIEQARILARSSHSHVAIPHAQSALALMEQTEAGVLRNRFNQLEADYVSLQLEVPFDLSAEVETVQAQVIMQRAQVAARQGDWETALNLLERAVSMINIQNLLLKTEK